MLDVPDEELYKFSDREIRKVTQIIIMEEEGLIAMLAGNSNRMNYNATLMYYNWVGYWPDYAVSVSKYLVDATSTCT